MAVRRFLMVLALTGLAALLVRDVMAGALLWAAVAWLALALNGAVIFAGWRGTATPAQGSSAPGD